MADDALASATGRSSPPRARPLVVVIGSLRGNDDLYRSVIRHLLQPLEADLAVDSIRRVEILGS